MYCDGRGDIVAQKSKRRQTFLNKTGGSQERARENFGSFMNERAGVREQTPYGGQAIRKEPEERPKPYVRPGVQRRFDRRHGLRQGLFEKFVRWVDRAIAEPIVNWISAGEPNDPEAIANMQKQLSEAGRYNGPIDGQANDEFMSVIREMEAG